MMIRPVCPKCGEGEWATTAYDAITVDGKPWPIRLRCTDCGHQCLHMDLVWIAL